MSKDSSEDTRQPIKTTTRKSNQHINGKDREGILKQTTHTRNNALLPRKTDREWIESNLEGMLQNALAEARDNGYDSTLEITESGYAGHNAEPLTALDFAFKIEREIRYYKTLLERLDSQVDSETKQLVEQLIAKILNIANNHHLMWVAENERALLAGVSNLNSHRGKSHPYKHKRDAANLYKTLTDSGKKSGEAYTEVCAEYGPIARTTLLGWVKKFK